jgi:hypothetical protein
MAYLEILQKHNADLGGLIEKANSLPEKSDFGKQLDALIDGSMTEVNSGATRVKNYTFYGCNSMISANLPYATEIGFYAFAGCSKLTTATIPNATKIAEYLFNGCEKLENVNTQSATSIGQYAFSGCYKLLKVVAPNAEIISHYAFSNCPELICVDTKAWTVGRYAFQYCYSLKSVILRSQSEATLSNVNAFQACYHFHGTVNSTYNPNGDKDGYIYVPRALVEDYKVDTNWSTLSTQFRALEDYTVDGTTTGALDPNKI